MSPSSLPAHEHASIADAYGEYGHDREHHAEPLVPPYDPALTNDDIAPLKHQKWGAYNIFAFWMSDVHSVGGYVTAGALFAGGLNGWQVLLALVIGIIIVNVFANLVAKPSQVTSVPFPVIARSAYGVKGAYLPAFIRGVMAIAWYGIQTFLASEALIILALKIHPAWGPYADKSLHGFLGLSTLGWVAFLIMWFLQALVFWRGMAAIRKFIDFCGPAVYVVMLLLAVYLVAKAGVSHISFTLSDKPLHGTAAFSAFCVAVATVVSYFSGPTLNYGDIARYGKSYGAVKRGNFLGLPVNFLVFSLLVVLTASATVPVYGKLITDPVETMKHIDSTWAIALGVFTLVVATAGINIVANFIAPAFDFSTIAPKVISWRTGGMIAAVGSVLITPWNLYSNPDVIHYTLDTLGAFVGPLFGVLIAFYYGPAKQRVKTDDLFTLSPKGRYFYAGGINVNAVLATVVGGVAALACVFVSGLSSWSPYAWFVGAGLAAATFLVAEKISPRTAPLPSDDELAPSYRVEGGAAHG